jgi:O-antigen/teichoic acid export membrane protein
MNRFGMPLVPSALALWAVNFLDRFLLIRLEGKGATGQYSVAVRVASAIAFLLYAFRTAWPAYAYSIKEDKEARLTYSFVLTYLVYLTSWVALALGVLAPWIVTVLAQGDKWTAHDRSLAAGAVAPLAFSLVAYGAYTVVAIGVGRARKTGFNWIVTGLAAVLNVALVFALVPPFGIRGAAFASLVSFVAMFFGMVWNAQRVYPIQYQWRRIATVAVAAGAITLGGQVLDGPLALELALVCAFPLLLLPLGFYLPEERARLGALLRR